MSIDDWKIIASDGAIFSARVFSMMLGISSGPEALLGLLSFSNLYTPAVGMTRG